MTRYELRARDGTLEAVFSSRRDAVAYAQDLAEQLGIEMQLVGVGLTCEDCDRECPVCRGTCQAPATARLVRMDYESSPTAEPLHFCAGCADDAMASGVFSPADDVPEAS